MIYETQEQLEEAVREWQGILRLQDWDIIARFSDRRELTEWHKGQCLPNWKNRECDLVLRHTIEPYPGHPPLDHEKTLVHELLHIPFEPFAPEDEESMQYKLWEQCVDVLSKALLALKLRAEAAEQRVRELESEIARKPFAHRNIRDVPIGERNGHIGNLIKECHSDDFPAADQQTLNAATNGHT